VQSQQASASIWKTGRGLITKTYSFHMTQNTTNKILTFEIKAALLTGLNQKLKQGVVRSLDASSCTVSAEEVAHSKMPAKLPCITRAQTCVELVIDPMLSLCLPGYVWSKEDRLSDSRLQE
jgi:hypothetical protein